MDEDDDRLISRSIFITVGQDATLRELAHRMGVSKNDLIRTAVTDLLVKLQNQVK